MSKNNTNIRLVGLPLTVAVSGAMLTGCMAVPSKNTTTTVTTRTPAVVKSPTANNPYVYNNHQVGLLDADSLNELSALLDAKEMTMVENDPNSINQLGDLWNRVRQGYGINRVNAYNPRIEGQKGWFVKNQKHLNSMAARASRYLYYTVNEAQRRNLPTELALLPIIESSYDPSRTSKASAAGMWQFIPSTGKIYGLQQTKEYDGRRDVIESTNAAYDYLTKLYNQFGDWELALAAYNGGPGRVQKAIEKNRNAGKKTDFWSLSLPNETMNYVPRFLAVSEIVGNPNTYGVYLPAIANKQHFDTIPVSSGVHLNDIATIVGAPLEELRNLNPGLLNNRVVDSSPQRVIVPMGLNSNQVAQIQGLVHGSVNGYTPPANSYNNTNYGTNNNPYYTPNRPKSFTPKQGGHVYTPNTNQNTYTVQPNDSLESIAQRAGVSVRQLAQWNNISPNGFLQPGTILRLNNAGQTQPNNSFVNNRPTDKKSSKPIRTSEYYIVQPGDTLLGTSRQLGISREKLARYNNLTTESLLYKNQKLWLVPGKVVAKSTKKTNVITHNETISSPKSRINRAEIPKNTYTGKLTRYQIQANDTLSGLANRHGVSLTTLAGINGVSTEYLVKKDEFLKVPDNGVKTNSQTIKNTVRPQTYEVKQGDSLTAVSARFGVSLSALAAANDMSTDDHLLKDTTIIIPAISASDSVYRTKHSSAVARGGRSHSIRPTENYTVKSGDGLIALARRFNVSVPELAKINNFSTESDLIIGQVIKIPTSNGSYTVRSGDSLTNLSVRYGVTVQKLAAMNGLAVDEMLLIGQTIKVPY